MIQTRIDGQIVPPLAVEQIATHAWGPGLLWVDAVAPDDDELDYLVKAFTIHPLAEEDIRHRNQRPKMDQYDDNLFIVVFGAAETEDRVLEFRELHLLVGPRSVLSISDQHLPPIATLHEKCQVRPQLASGEPGQLVYRLIDAAVDSFFPVIDHLEAGIDRLETRILDQPDGNVVADIIDLKRSLNVIRKLLAPQRDLLQGLAGVHGPALGHEAQLYLRDVYDHAVRLVEEVDSARDFVTGALDVYLSSLSNRLGEQTRRLSTVATIFLPLTFLTGFFGQNFGFLIENITTARAFALGISCEVVSIVVIWFTIRWLTERARPVPRARQEGGSRTLSLRLRTRRASPDHGRLGPAGGGPASAPGSALDSRP